MEILEKRLLEAYLRSGSTFDSNKKTGPNFRISTSKLFFGRLKIIAPVRIHFYMTVWESKVLNSLIGGPKAAIMTVWTRKVLNFTKSYKLSINCLDLLVQALQLFMCLLHYN